MVFSYYNRLKPVQKRIYRKSDAIHAVPLPNAADLHHLIPPLVLALKEGDVARTEDLCGKLATGIASGLKAPPVRVKVLAARPSADWGELHGLYVPAEGQAAALITVWMRTAQRRQVVAFRSFVRTLLHEICHHLDYELFMLEESYHTDGFYKRESSLFHQLTVQIEKQNSF
ncbi:MAG: hypothetical protein A2078_06435 [Nitrospirae bacterium GWC2_57_9]|nr:MAG: hypothetical protein A2078_06435 [Nitrospirae bacterium GWC2_57_9]